MATDARPRSLRLLHLDGARVRIFFKQSVKARSIRHHLRRLEFRIALTETAIHMCVKIDMVSEKSVVSGRSVVKKLISTSLAGWKYWCWGGMFHIVLEYRAIKLIRIIEGGITFITLPYFESQ